MAAKFSPISVTRLLHTIPLLLLLFALGCGGDSNTSEVRGKVEFDGTPVEDGAISFIPADGKAPTAGGRIQDGTYKARVPIGHMKVSIRWPKVVGQKPLYNKKDSKTRSVMAERIPARYNDKTELILDVTAGKMEKDFNLKSK